MSKTTDSLLVENTRVEYALTLSPLIMRLKEVKSEEELNEIYKFYCLCAAKAMEEESTEAKYAWRLLDCQAERNVETEKQLYVKACKSRK